MLLFVCFRQGPDQDSEAGAKEGRRRGGAAAAVRAGVGHVAALHVPPRVVHRLVSVWTQVLQEQRQQRQNGVVPLRHQDLPQVPLVRVPRQTEAALSLGRVD